MSDAIKTYWNNLSSEEDAGDNHYHPNSPGRFEDTIEINRNQ